MSQGADPDEIGLMNIDEQLPVLEYPQPGLDIIQVKWLDSPSLVLMKLSFVVFLQSIKADTTSSPTNCFLATGADIAPANQEPPSLSIPPHSPAQRRG